MTTRSERRPTHPNFAYGATETPVGRLLLVATSLGLASCSFEPEAVVLPRLERLSGSGEVAADAVIDLAWRELSDYFAGRLRRFTVPVDLRLASDFSRMALLELRDVPFGATLTAEQLAARIGRARAVRAIDNTLATNPLCVVLPCHRVVPDRYPEEAGRYPAGPDTKRRLLALESAAA